MYCQELNPRQESSTIDTLLEEKAQHFNKQYILHLDSFYQAYITDSLLIDSLLTINQTAFSFYEQSNQAYQNYYKALTNNKPAISSAIQDTENKIKNTSESAYAQAYELKQKAQQAATNKKKAQLLWKSENWKHLGNTALQLLLSINEQAEIEAHNQNTPSPVLEKLYYIQDSILAEPRQWPFFQPSISKANKPKALQKIPRHYSVFSNITDTFFVVSPPPKLKLVAKNDTPPYLTNQITKEYTATSNSTTNKPYGTFALNQADTLGVDNYFLHQHITTYTKPDLKQSWYNYLAQSQTTITPTTQTNNNTSIQTQHTATKEENQQVTTNQALFIQKDTSPLSPPTNQITRTETKGTVQYFIQIAACRDTMSKMHISHLYANHKNITYRFEENWHKYQIPAFENYQSALTLLKNIKVAGAFIVAYQDNRKLNLWETIQRTPIKTNPIETIQFRLQVSASRTPLSPEEIKSLNTSSDEMIIITEDGWYKYQVIIGSSYRLTLEKWRTVGVTISFPVAYVNNQKANMSEVLQTIRNHNMN